VIGIIAAFVATGCSSVNVSTDWDREADFSDYRSFSWFERAERPVRPPNRRREASPLVEQRVVREVSAQLRAKGYDQVPVRQADFLVTYHTDVHREVRVTHSGYGYRGWRHGTSHRYSYPVGTLIVDVIDAGRRELVWRGVATGSFGSGSPSEDKVRKVVARIMADFPPS
jgi:hypothetical protein